ncbi:unnamed protein product [Lymnaea stagnalis]|uniref:Uncharacterized protein n=1 Tax=Lymnaea stagnalis TaxID=6523 RepID=A0AAV2HF99_LYMST
MSTQLDGKVAIVTGSSSGIGEAIAITFASRGAKVTLCGRDPDRLQSVLRKAVEVSGGHKDRFITVLGDVGDEVIRKRIVEETVTAFGQLDILVPNAGVSVPHATIRDATPELYDSVMDINVKAVFFLVQVALPSLEKSKGNIVFVSSMLSALTGVPLIVYPMSKAAIDHLARCLAVELGPKGIRVNTVNPSYIPTRIRRAYDPNVEAAALAWSQKELAVQPLQGRAGTAQDVAEAAAFLASDAAGFITGQHVILDGGRSFCGTYGASSKPTEN